MDIPSVVADDVEGVREELGEDGPMVRPGYVRYPPRQWAKDAPPALVVQLTEGWLLHLKDAEWKSTGNPVAAVESIIMRHREGVFPSVAVMQWLAQGFEDWHNNQGHKSLEQCLGLKRPGGHTANQMREAIRAQQVETLLKLMLQLHCAFRLRIKEAAGVVAAWREDPGWNQSSYDLKPLSEDTLLDYWKGCGWVKGERIREQLRLHFQEDAAQQELLDQFPLHAYQHLLKTHPDLKRFS